MSLIAQHKQETPPVPGPVTLRVWIISRHLSGLWFMYTGATEHLSGLFSLLECVLRGRAVQNARLCQITQHVLRVRENRTLPTNH